MKNSSLEENKAVVQRYVDEIQNEHNLDAIESIFSSDFIDHMDSFGGLFQGLDGLKRGYAALLNAFPDLHVTVEDMIAEDDKVVIYKTATGTHCEEYQGIPATGKKIEFTNIYIFRIKDKKIAEYWGLYDEYGVKRQLGVVGIKEYGEKE
jgi:steroid delta-isomerase-like uncharacterized protein